MTDLQDAISDFIEEGARIDHLLADLEDQQWQLPTPAPGWTIKHQVAHLTATFRLAELAVAKPDTFTKMASSLSDDFDANVHGALVPFLVDTPEALLGKWRAVRADTASALAAVSPDKQVPWLVRPLSPRMLASAGLMELFAHGQDIYDALGEPRESTDSLRHLVAFAVRNWDFGYLSRGLTVPDTEFRFEITAPSGELWAFGPEDATQRVTGSATDFCLLVTRRRHPDDLALASSGSHADHWMGIAQAYRGSAGQGRVAGQFAGSPNLSSAG